jgi:hypothetical protein
MKEHAPLLYSVMMTTATPNRKKYDATEWLPSVAIAAAVLLKQRCRMVNSVHRSYTVAQYHSGTTLKQDK